MSPSRVAERVARWSHRGFAASVSLLLGSSFAVALAITPALLQDHFDASLFKANLFIFEPYALSSSIISFVAFARRPHCKETAERWVFKGLLCVFGAIIAISAIDASRLHPCIMPLCNQPDTESFLQRLGAEVLLVCVTTVFLLLTPWFLGGIGGFVIWRYTRVARA